MEIHACHAPLPRCLRLFCNRAVLAARFFEKARFEKGHLHNRFSESFCLLAHERGVQGPVRRNVGAWAADIGAFV